MDDKIEVEMKELTPEEKQDNKDEEKGKMDETKDAETKKGETNLYCKLNNPEENVYSLAMSTSSQEKKEEAVKLEEKNKARKEEEAIETNVYTKLENPSENVYMSVTNSKAKQNEDVNRKVCLYKWISIIFIILSLILLAVVLALATKLSEVQSSECPDIIAEEESPAGCRCEECEEDWEKFGDSCYFFSRERLSWQESRTACQKQGGDLAVVDSEHIQKFLSENGVMFYWIGLHYSEEKQWTWINNTALTLGYWSEGQSGQNLQGSCAVLIGQPSNLNNWISKFCNSHSHYICRKR